MHPLEDHPLPGIGAGRRRRLADAGVLTLQELVAFGVDELARLPHIPRPVAEAAVASAAAILAASRVDMVIDAAPFDEPYPELAEVPVEELPELATSPTSPPAGSGASPSAEAPPRETANTPSKKAKGKTKRARRRAAAVAALRRQVKDARKHARRGPKGKQRGKLRTELRAVLDLLDQLPKRLRRLSGKKRRHVVKQLERIDGTLTVFLAKAPRPGRMRKARRQVASARRAVVGTATR